MYGLLKGGDVNYLKVVMLIALTLLFTFKIFSQESLGICFHLR